MRRLLNLLLSLATLAALTGCAAQPAAQGGPLRVVVTTGHLADAVRNVGGDLVDLSPLLGPGIDPHTYIPTEGDIVTLQSAQVIFYNGLRLEAQMDEAFTRISEGGRVTVVGVGDSLDLASLLSWEPEAGLPYDPHVWNDVTLWIKVVETIRDTLAAADAANAQAYSANAARYIGELEALHRYMAETAAGIPAERRLLVTAHDAFNYFGRAYGLEVAAVQGISTASEAGAADIQALAQLVLERDVPAIFVETTVSPRTIEAVQAAVKAGGQEVRLGGTLYSDALGEPGSGADTYITMMRHNIDTIAAALAG